MPRVFGPSVPAAVLLPELIGAPLVGAPANSFLAFLVGSMARQMKTGGYNGHEDALALAGKRATR
jgi:hypothetical protein